jgi:hypothetical protein
MEEVANYKMGTEYAKDIYQPRKISYPEIMVKALEQHKREAHDRRIPVTNSAEDLFGACKLGRARRRIARFGPSDSDALLTVTHGA